jgi:hypothetical protein
MNSTHYSTNVRNVAVSGMKQSHLRRTTKMDIVPPITLQRHQQIRHFVAKVKYSMKGFGPNGNMLKICFCYSDHDLFAKPKTTNHEKYQYFKSKPILSEIKERTREEFETSEDLEYFNGIEWLPLTNVKDIASWKGGEKVLNIRVPSRWDEFIHYNDIKSPSEDDVVDPNKLRGYYEMEAVIEALVLLCKSTDMTRSKIKPYHLQNVPKKPEIKITDVTRSKIRNTDMMQSKMKPYHLQNVPKTEISTKQWILNEAESDPLLQSVILRQPGTLDHIVQCLHYDVTWRKVLNDDPKVHPSNQNHIQIGSISRSTSLS